MDIKDAEEKAKELDSKITHLIRQFNQETGLNVMAIELTYKSLNRGGAGDVTFMKASTEIPFKSNF